MSTESKKRGLGRGLDALFRDAKAEEGAQPQHPIKRADELAMASAQARAAAQSAPAAPVAAPTSSAPMAAPIAPNGETVRKLGIEKLQPGKYQPRRVFDDETLDELAESIAAHGILQPLLVRPVANGMYEIIGGERRWRAAQRAQLHEVPVVMRELDDKTALELGLIENLQREDLSALEEAEGYQRLIAEFGHTQEAVAASLGKSRTHVTNALRLLKLPESVRAMIAAGSLTAGHARALVGAANAEDLARRIAKGGLSVRQAEKLARDAATGKKPAAPTGKKMPRVKDADVMALEDKMTALLGLAVTIEGEGAEGRLSIAYKTLDQLDDLLARLSNAP